MGFSQTVEWKILLAIDIMAQLHAVIWFSRGGLSRESQVREGKGVRWCFQKYQYLGESGGIPPGKHLGFIRQYVRPLLVGQLSFLKKTAMKDSQSVGIYCTRDSHLECRTTVVWNGYLQNAKGCKRFCSIADAWQHPPEVRTMHACVQTLPTCTTTRVYSCVLLGQMAPLCGTTP